MDRVTEQYDQRTMDYLEKFRRNHLEEVRFLEMQERERVLAAVAAVEDPLIADQVRRVLELSDVSVASSGS